MIQIQTEWFQQSSNALNPNSTDDFQQNYVRWNELIITPGELCEGCAPNALFDKLHITPTQADVPTNMLYNYDSSNGVYWRQFVEGLSLHHHRIKVEDALGEFGAFWMGEFNYETGGGWAWGYPGMGIERGFLFALNVDDQPEDFHKFYQRPMTIELSYRDNQSGQIFTHTQEILFRYHGVGMLCDVNNDGVCDILDIFLI